MLSNFFNKKKSSHIKQDLAERMEFAQLEIFGDEMGRERTGLTYQEFEDFISSAGLSTEQLAIVLFQVFLFRLPTIDELESCALQGDNKIHSYIVKKTEFYKKREDKIWRSFKSCSNDTLVIDVTHTNSYKKNSGIQRVVRSIAREITNKQMANYLFVEVCEDLTVKEVSKNFFEWDSVLVSKSIRSSFLKRYLKKLLGSTITRLLSYLLLKFRKTFVEAQGVLFSTSDLQKHYSVFWWKQKILLPELIADTSRVNLYYVMRRYLNVRLTMIFYDFIPLKFPEVAPIAQPFAVYTKLLSVADGIACISNTVACELRHFLSMLSTNNSSQVIETIYLAADFAPPESFLDEAPLLQTANTRIGICVGTIEPRKNNLRILKAVTNAMEEGIDFEFVFLGNRGWGSDFFLHELDKAINLGFRVSYVESPTDIQLLRAYKSAYFSIFASYAEGFGLPIVESVKSNVPCIVSRVGCTGEIATTLGGCVLVDPFNFLEIKKAIQDIFSDDVLYEKLRNECKKATWVSWEKYADSVVKFCMVESAN